MNTQTTVEFGEWIAVAWGGNTDAPSGCSYRLSLTCRVEREFEIVQLEQVCHALRQRLLEAYDHRELTPEPFVPGRFLQQVAIEVTEEVTAQGLCLLQVSLRDHDQWSMHLDVSATV